MTPLVSLIIPCYNAEKFITASIEGVLAQTFADFEAIFVNDGSTDHTAALLKLECAKDSRLRFITQVNGGASSARNTGIESAHGQYICFADVDDRITPNYLKQLVERANVADADLVVSGLMARGQQTYDYLSIEGLYSHNRFIEMLNVPAYQMLLNGPYCKLFKRDIILQNKLSFKPDIHFGEDAIFVYEYLLHCTSVAFCDGAEYYYDLRPGSLSRKAIEWNNVFLEYTTFNSVLTQLKQKFGSEIADTRNIACRVIEHTNRCWTAALATQTSSTRRQRLQKIDFGYYRKQYRASSFAEKVLLFILSLKAVRLYDLLLRTSKA